MAAKLPKLVFPTFKRNCLGKAKVVLDSINRHTSGSLDSKEILKLKEKREALKDQFVRM